MNDESKCPMMGGTNRHSASGSMANQHWWPNQLNLKMLSQNSPLSDPMGEEFDYAEEFKTLDLDALKKDIGTVMTTSQEWWPVVLTWSSSQRDEAAVSVASQRPRSKSPRTLRCTRG